MKLSDLGKLAFNALKEKRTRTILTVLVLFSLRALKASFARSLNLIRWTSFFFLL